MDRRERRRLRKERKMREREESNSRERNRSLGKAFAYLVVIVIVVIGAAYGISAYAGFASGQPGPYDEFAQCITDSGAELYGAYWCGNCQRQKLNFGDSFEYLDYTECDAKDPEGKGQPLVCDEKGIVKYPTWIIDGAKYTGLKSMQELSELTGCEF
jgi:hypothetical protein